MIIAAPKDLKFVMWIKVTKGGSHANFQDISNKMKTGDGFVHDVFENHRH